MKHSEINSNQSNFGIQLSTLDINKSFPLSEQTISVSSSNSNTLMINPVIPTHININSGALINTTLNSQRSINLAILAKPNNTSAAAMNSNLSSLTLHPNNTIKFVNLSKCQQISNINKDNSSNVQNNTINVQFVTNTSNTGCINEPSISLQPNCKIDNITLNPNSLTTSSTNQTVSTAPSSHAGTRLVIQGPPSQLLHPLTFIHQTPDLANNSMANNHLIKNPKYVYAGNKQHQTIRPVTAGTVSAASQNNIIKQPISIISPSKTINNFGTISTLNMPDISNQTGIQDMTVNRGLSAQNESQKSLKNPPMKIPLHSYSVSTNSNNNIRLALTSNINNSRIHMNQSKIQLISPKSRKRSGSPINAIHDNKIRNPPIVSKDENIDNSISYNNQVGNYSPTRKRARKQHLKSVSTKSQKPIINQKLLLNKIEPLNHLNNIRPALNEKIMPTTVVVPTAASKASNVSFQNKTDDTMPTSTSTSINAPIFIGIKNPIQICPPKTSTTNQSLSHRPTTIFPNNNIIGSNTNNNNATITSVNQFQIISQNQNIKQIQLSPNIIISPKGKSQTFSPSKVIHIAPSTATINRNTLVKNEILTNESTCSSIINVEKPVVITEKKEKLIEPIKLENSDIKSETSEDSNVKISLFPIKYQWNARRNHFQKKLDVKFKKAKSTPTTKFTNNLSSSENQEDDNFNNEAEINDMNWFFYKAFGQILMQKSFDEENLKTIYKLKEKFDVGPQVDDLSKPIFRKICAKTQFYVPIPDQIDVECLSKYTDPHLFGISEDIIENYVNSITKNDSEISETKFPNTQSHECTPACIFYSLEVPPTNQPQKFSKIIDLIEGLIVKEKNIIEKESEINNQFLKFLRRTTDFTSQNKKSPNKTNNHTDRIKLLSGYRR